MAAIHIRNKVNTQRFGIGFQRFRDHHRPEIRTANTNINHIGNGFTVKTFLVALAHTLRKSTHFVEHTIDFRHNVFTIDQNRVIGAIP